MPVRLERWQTALCRAMPKAELHLHLDGALEPKTAMELAGAQGWRGFERPLPFSEMYGRLVLPGQVCSQAELLAYFAVPGLLLQTPQALRRVTDDLIAAKAADHVRYCEIRWAPLLHTAGGMRVREILETVIQAAAGAGERLGVHVELIAVAMRTHTPGQNLALLEELAPLAGKGIAAVDMAGQEAAAPELAAHLPFFEKARSLGFGVTLHCGELAGSAPRLRRQIEELRPHRVAHGPGAADDTELCALLRERDIMLDLCPTSNLQAGLYPDYESYPLRRLVERGVPVSISTDDNVLSDLSLSDEYVNLLRAGQLNLPALWARNLDALRHGFAPAAVRGRLLREFGEWAGGTGELDAAK